MGFRKYNVGDRVSYKTAKVTTEIHKYGGDIKTGRITEAFLSLDKSQWFYWIYQEPEIISEDQIIGLGAG